MRVCSRLGAGPTALQKAPRRQRQEEAAEKRNLPLVSCVLQHGDVLQWAALAADRKLTLRNVPAEAGDPAWLRNVFTLADNSDGLCVVP